MTNLKKPLLLFILVWIQSSFAQAQQNENLFKFQAPLSYTSGEQTDYTKTPSPKVPKGATVLIWKKNYNAAHAEVEITQVGLGVKRSFFVDSHFFHINAYFDRPLKWRVRFVETDEKPLSASSEYKNFKVVRKNPRVHKISSVGEVIETAPNKNLEKNAQKDLAGVQAIQNSAVPQVRKVSVKQGVTNAIGRGLASVVNIQIPAPAPNKRSAQLKAMVLKKLFVDELGGNNEVEFNY